MGYGDNLMASGIARDLGRRVAFGDEAERRIIWDHHSEEVFRGNPLVAPPGSEGEPNLTWVKYHRGHRLYNQQLASNRWKWRHSWKPKPGELYLTDEEVARALPGGFVLIEPNVPSWKTVAPNKQWPADRFVRVAREVMSWGREVVQLNYGERYSIPGARLIRTRTFRDAAILLHRAAYALLPEGGLHHAAAARTRLGDRVLRESVPAVVLFGGFIPPRSTGYACHVNVTGGAEACGNFTPCDHCELAMRNISVESVVKELVMLEHRSRG